MEKSVKNEEQFSIREYIRGYIAQERYPADISPEELGDISLCPNEKYLIDKIDWQPNIIVSSVANLVAGLFQNHAPYSGVQRMAVGSGDAAWDSLPNRIPPAPVITQTRLDAEIGRVVPVIIFLAPDNTASSTPTNRIQVTGTFGAADANGSWREMGVFGGNSTASINTGILINYIRFPIITKVSTETIVRRVRFVF